MTSTDSSTKAAPTARPWPWTDPITGRRYGGSRRVPHRTLVLIRWLAVIGQSITVVVVGFGLGFPLPLIATTLVIAASVLMNVIVMARRPRAGRLRDGEATGYLAFDIVQLAALLYFTGGLNNPFSILILAPVTVSATMLPRRATVLLAAVAIVSASVIAVFHWPLPWPGDDFALPRVYVIGIWAGIVVGTVFIVFYLGSLTREGQRMQDALDATQLALTREQHNAAVGALAAAAAHELGSPLSTIAVTAKELAREPTVVEALGADIEILLSEIGRCREILAELGQADELDADDPYSVLPLTALIDIVVAQNDNPARTIKIEHRAADDSIEPQVARSPEFIHGLGNIIQNAGQFAAKTVTVDIVWSAATIAITVRDDGPGFPSTLLDRIGEPYISTRSGGGEHMGLGLFIAQTLLERTGASLTFGNAPQGGGRVELVWQRRHLEYMKS